MKYHSHQDVASVGLCRICMKGLRMGCATREDFMDTHGKYVLLS